MEEVHSPFTLTVVGEPRGLNAAQIGRRLRDLRAARALSLRQLAKLISASPSLLSQIENGKVTPSVDTLYLLAGALETPVASFFGDPVAVEPAGDAGTWIVRRTTRKRIRLEHGVTWENLLPAETPGLRFMEIRYAAGGHSGENMLRHPGRDLFLVLEGQLKFSVGFAEHVLGPGDAISFADFQPHHVRNDGRVEAVAILCVVGDEERARPAAASPAGR
jgi:transcriptional regulator with XRE-family HTH domain